MKTLLKLLVCLLFTVSVSLGVFPRDALAVGQFTLTCDNINICGSILSATCKKIDQTPQSTSLDLDPFIENVDGVLKWQPSRFIVTCGSTQVKENSNKTTTMSAYCLTRDQRPVATNINLDDHIANINGVLTYQS